MLGPKTLPAPPWSGPGTDNYRESGIGNLVACRHAASRRPSDSAGNPPPAVRHLVTAPSTARLIDVPTFDVVDAVTPVGTAPCAECRGPIVDTYYEADEGVICAACHPRVASSVTNQASHGRFSRALGLGVIA